MVIVELFRENTPHSCRPVLVFILSHTEALLDVWTGQAIFALIILTQGALHEGVESRARARQNAGLDARVVEISAVVLNVVIVFVHSVTCGLALRLHEATLGETSVAGRLLYRPILLITCCVLAQVRHRQLQRFLRQLHRKNGS